MYFAKFKLYQLSLVEALSKCRHSFVEVLSKTSDKDKHQSNMKVTIAWPPNVKKAIDDMVYLTCPESVCLILEYIVI